MEKRFALVDCNSFYASCEKIFRPDLWNKPVVVLSNNDGCVVALSKEAKKIGIKRTTPIFEVQKLINEHDVAVFSSNYTLYGDISDRVMTTLRDFTPDLEIYSIDEAFLDLSGFQHLNLSDYAIKIRDTVFKHIGIPVSIGIGQTKTLAKLANHIAKKYSCYNGIFDITDNPNLEKIFRTIPVNEVWGVGRQYAKMLAENGIIKIYDLLQKSDTWIKKHLTINGLYMTWELKGRNCIELQTVASDRKNIVSSRSFGIPVTTKRHLKEAVAYYATIACEKLRKQNSICGCIVVFIGTNRFKPNKPQYFKSIPVVLDPPTSYTNDIISAADAGLEKIYRNGYEYKKAGVMLLDIISEDKYQYDLFADIDNINKKKTLMKTIDKITKSYGRDLITSASFSYRKPWGMMRNMKSPNYTTSWDQLPIVKC
jgi:DNA polymerase V